MPAPNGHFLPWGHVIVGQKCTGDTRGDTTWYCIRTPDQVWFAPATPLGPLSVPDIGWAPGPTNRPHVLLTVPDHTNESWDTDVTEAIVGPDAIAWTGHPWGIPGSPDDAPWNQFGGIPDHMPWLCDHCQLCICPWCARTAQVCEAAPGEYPLAGAPAPCHRCENLLRYLTEMPPALQAGWVCGRALLPDAVACPFTHTTAQRHGANPGDLAGMPRMHVAQGTAQGAVRSGLASRDDEPT